MLSKGLAYGWLSARRRLGEMVLPVITLNGWDAMPERSRELCLTLTDRAVATIDEIDALEVFG